MKLMRKVIADLIREAMNQHELARDFYHRMANRVTHPETRETFEYLAQEAEENKARLPPGGTLEGPGSHGRYASQGCPGPGRQALGRTLPVLPILGGDAASRAGTGLHGIYGPGEIKPQGQTGIPLRQ
jgi:hypothetical protein